MNREELIKKAKELLNDGQLEKAKIFIEEHKDELGDYYDKAKTFLNADKIDELKDQFKKFFK
ncbi:hypothetical protein P7D52_07400 [Enterococcus dongliensis]|uniref:Uncharacterized protein n=1 Tax=Enterococcus dongliensis TaxID=2559925 RepID=A0AAP5NLJ3_9ENTE|nr:hypothetical protein [Enterococcus dongliensis]MDT2596689.1 hypothetical protein [Enterococcus dongliensis]MDT2604216.1 hypothetical protein [Enterococcus dongliensis]MDT2613440.1 hypothetical protein [Enterococcus dongliensis]MDT2634592.1 hypothetical protein [Enterococcus dongliensis]MDT2637584.1 hypothetical protein [Enterococcus dongliensis]